MSTILLTGYHTGELETVSYEIPQLADICRWNKGRFDHTAHIQITDPFGIFTVGLVTFHRLGIFGMRKSDPKVMFLENVENRDPILSGRFHTNIFTVVFSKPVTQLIQSFCEGRKASLLILSAIMGISDTDTGIDPCFVDIKSTAVVFDNLKRQ